MALLNRIAEDIIQESHLYGQNANNIENEIKRLIDIIASLFVLILFCWLYAIIAVLVRIKLGSPILFKQNRPGKIDPKTGKEKIFRLYKFRTMTDERDENGELLPDEVRLTSFGAWLRRTSMDEIPELLNILRGDMSIVGPRPLLTSYLQYYTEEERHRHDVKPGLTGYAQVHGRNYVTWEDKFKMDLWYVEHISFLTDIKILWDTVLVVFKRENIETASKIVHDGVTYQPLDVERSKAREKING